MAQHTRRSVERKMTAFFHIKPIGFEGRGIAPHIPTPQNCMRVRHVSKRFCKLYNFTEKQIAYLEQNFTDGDILFIEFDAEQIGMFK